MSKNNELITQKRFNTISIGLASPEVILGNSRGEVLKPETINYRTHKPESCLLYTSPSPRDRG